jgi:hypothetical protein
VVASLNSRKTTREKNGPAEIYPQLNAERKSLRESVGFWEENWGAHSDMAFPNTTTKKLRIEFGSPKVFVDELEVFGPADFRKNLAHQNTGTTLVESSEMLQKGSTVEKANDGKYGTMVWKAAARKNSKEKPWVEINFPKPIEVNRFRFSSNREYHLETDYLEKMPGSYYPGFRVLTLQDDGTWKGSRLLPNSPGNHLRKIRKLVELPNVSKPILQRFVKKVLITLLLVTLLNLAQPKSSTAVALKTHVMKCHPAGFTIMEGDLGLDSSAKDPVRRKKFADWLTNPKHPLTARVMVNRIWHHLFGTGIVPTTADFGIAGAKPYSPRTPRLACFRIHRKWLVHQSHDQTNHADSGFSTLQPP